MFEVQSLVLFCSLLLISNANAWLAPERCAQGSSRRYAGRSTNLTLVRTRSSRNSRMSIDDFVSDHISNLDETYKNHKFLGIPIQTKFINAYSDLYSMYAAYDCAFYTHSPRLIVSVLCADGHSCSLSEAVSTVDTYTPSEGYNWGVKMNTKLSLFEKVFEIGGEVSAGGTYSCTYTKGKTITRTVSCTEPHGKGEILALYEVKSDMQCRFGEITYENDPSRCHYEGPDSSFTDNEIRAIINSAMVPMLSHNWDDYVILVDLDKISENLLQKLKRVFTNYNPYIDLVSIDNSGITIYCAKVRKVTEAYKKIIPFTNENGDSVRKYACI